MTHGIVHWEIGVKDLDSSSRFYEQLFGWKTSRMDDNYRMVDTGDGLGGGLMKLRDGMPPYVTVYVASEDIPAMLAEVPKLGGKLLVPPQEIPGVGTFAMFQDPDGNPVGILHGVMASLPA